MAITKQQRQAAIIALVLTASAGGGYVSRDALIAIGQRYCGPVPKAIMELPNGQRLDATAKNIERINQQGAEGVTVKLELVKAQGLLSEWCDPDRQQLTDNVDMKIAKGEKT